MTTFIAVVHKEPNSSYGVHFPDVAGCFSAADDMNDIIANASEALALYFEDEAEIKPSRLDQIKAMEEVQKDLAKGAFLIAVPLITLTGRIKKANITMDAGLLSAIDEAAKERGITRSGFIADVAKRELLNQ